MTMYKNALNTFYTKIGWNLNDIKTKEEYYANLRQSLSDIGALTPPKPLKFYDERISKNER